jgi:CheY-like chemotaxis protein
MKRILIVDDNKDILQVVQLVLEVRGYEVMAIWDGNETVKAVEKFLPDVILLDVLLGNVSGIALCNEIKSNPKTKNTCIVMFSAHAKGDDILKLCSADAFIAKPFDIHHLSETIDKASNNCD